MSEHKVAGFVIEAGLQIPNWRKGAKLAPTTIALKALKPGESFQIPASKRKKTTGQVLYAAAKKNGIKVALRNAEDGSMRVWRVA